MAKKFKTPICDLFRTIIAKLCIFLRNGGLYGSISMLNQVIQAKHYNERVYSIPFKVCEKKFC